MSFLHLWFTISFPFTVLWHDLDLKHQNYLQRNISAEFYYQFVSLMIHNKINNVHHRMTFKEILSHLAEQSKNINKQCSHMKDGSKLPKHFTVPCGRMMVQHEHSFPLHYKWMIHTWHSMILNISLFEINIPVFDYQCSSNFLLLTEPDGMSFKQIATLCGRSRDKIFYSTRNSLTVKLEVNAGYEDILQLVVFQYQVMLQKALSFIEIKPKSVLQQLDLNLQLLHFISYSNGLVFFYNTWLSRKILVLMTNNNTVCGVLIYDGPSSRSALLKASINHQGRLQYKSTLYFITVYFSNIAAPYVEPSCFQATSIFEDTEPTIFHITSDKPINMPLNFDSTIKNIYHKLEFQTPSKNVNVKLQQFKYTGSNEAGCYLGGILFFSSRNPTTKYGPFCGELGQSLLSGKGLSLGPQPVTMILYLFADRVHSRAILFELSVKREPCIVIGNPCYAVPHRNKMTPETAALHKDGYTSNRFRGTNAVVIALDVEIVQSNPSLCYHMQHFMQTYHDEACVVQVMYFLLQKTLQVTVNMYYDRYQAQRCSNCSTSYMKVYPLKNNYYSPFFLEKVDKMISRKHQELSERRETASYNGSALQFGFIYNKTVSVLDEAFHIMISPKPRQHCTRYDLGTLQEQDTMNNYILSIHGWCASTTFQFKSDSHPMMFSIYPHSKLSFRIKFQNPSACHSETHVSALTMMNSMSSGTRYIMSWPIYESALDWTIINTSEDSKLQYILLFIAIISKDKIGYGVPNPFGNLLAGLAGLTGHKSHHLVECQELLDVHIQHEISHIQEHSALKTDSPQPTYCTHSSCYYLLVKERISWTYAFSNCDKLNQHLLAINSDFEARVIKNLMKKHQSFSRSTVVFLNLKKSHKVCIQDLYAIIL